MSVLIGWRVMKSWGGEEGEGSGWGWRACFFWRKERRFFSSLVSEGFSGSRSETGKGRVLGVGDLEVLPVFLIGDLMLGLGFWDLLSLEPALRPRGLGWDWVDGSSAGRGCVDSSWESCLELRCCDIIVLSDLFKLRYSAKLEYWTLAVNYDLFINGEIEKLTSWSSRKTSPQSFFL